MNSPVLQVFYIIFSGLLQSLSISNELFLFGSPFIALFCLIPFYICIYKSNSYLKTFFYFALQTLTVHLSSSYWLAHFHGFAIFTLGASALGTAALGGMCGIIFHGMTSFFSDEIKMQEFSGRLTFESVKRILWFSAVFITWEYIKSNGAMGYPWGTISMAAYKWKIFTQLADITGTWGITLLFVLFNATSSEFILHSKNPCKKNELVHCAKFTLFIFILSAAYGIIQYNIPRIPEKYLNVILTQQNKDPWETGDKRSIELSRELTEKGFVDFEENDKRPDLVIWSEGVLSKRFPQAAAFYQTYPYDESLSEYIAGKHTPFLIGGLSRIDEAKKKSGNAAVLFDSKGKFSGFYNKIQLVPFAEKIPYADNPLMHYFMKNIVGFSNSLLSGYQYVMFEIPLNSRPRQPTPLSYKARPFETISLNSSGESDWITTGRFTRNEEKNPANFVKFTVPICFEDAFPKICSTLFNMGSELFINITNDAWSKTKSAEIQHFIVASYRAVEFRTTLVRCANAGYTTVISPSGKILYDLPLFEESYMAAEIPVYSHSFTFYAKYGNWLASACILFIALYLISRILMLNISFSCKYKIQFVNESHSEEEEKESEENSEPEAVIQNANIPETTQKTRTATETEKPARKRRTVKTSEKAENIGETAEKKTKNAVRKRTASKTAAENSKKAVDEKPKEQKPSVKRTTKKTLEEKTTAESQIKKKKGSTDKPDEEKKVKTRTTRKKAVSDE